MATDPSSAHLAPVLGDVDELEVLRIPPALALPAAAVARPPRGELGVPELDEDPFWRLVASFLVECRARADVPRTLHRSEGLIRDASRASCSRCAG